MFNVVFKSVEKITKKSTIKDNNSNNKKEKID